MENGVHLSHLHPSGHTRLWKPLSPNSACTGVLSTRKQAIFPTTPTSGTVPLCLDTAATSEPGLWVRDPARHFTRSRDQRFQIELLLNRPEGGLRAPRLPTLGFLFLEVWVELCLHLTRFLSHCHKLSTSTGQAADTPTSRANLNPK